MLASFVCHLTVYHKRGQFVKFSHPIGHCPSLWKKIRSVPRARVVGAPAALF
jgi:hypothetical protein